MSTDQIVPGKWGHRKEPEKCRFRFPAPHYRNIYQREIRTEVE